MRLKLLTVVLPVILTGLSPVASANPRVHRGPTSSRLSRERATARPKVAGGISPERATEIQTALVKAGYLTESSGTWDAGTQAAMEKLQADNGWQVKLVPDARALIKLGLGPGSEQAATVAAPAAQ